MVTQAQDTSRMARMLGDAAGRAIAAAELEGVRTRAYVEAARRNRLSPGRAEAARPGAFHVAISESDMERLRSRGRALYRGTLLGRAIVDRVVQLVLGSGYTLAVAHEDQEWSELAEEALADEVLRINADLRSIVRQVLVDGDVLAVWGDQGKVHHVQADRITSQGHVTQIKGDGRIIAYGVEMDALGQALAYYVSPYSYGGQVVMGRATRYVAEDCTLIAELDWFGQPRGIPRLGVAADHVQRLEDFHADTATAAALQAHLIYYTRTNDPDLFGQTLPEPSPAPSADASMSATPRQGVSQPGSVIHLRTNEELNTVGPTQPGPQFATFVRAELSTIASAFGLPVEALMLDFSQTNFHSGKSALLLAQRAVEQWHALLLPYLRRRYAHAIEAAIDAEILPDPGVTGPRRHAHEWLRPAAPVLDPEGMARAEAEAIATRTDSYAAVLGRRGVDWREHFDQVRREQELLAEMGISAQPLQGAAVGDRGQPPTPTPTTPTPDPEGDSDGEDPDGEDPGDDAPRRGSPA